MNDFITHLVREKERLLGLITSIDNLLSEYSQYSTENQPYKTRADLSAPVGEVTKTTLGVSNLSLVYKGYSLKESVKLVVLGLERFTKVNGIVKILLEIYPEKRGNELNFQVQVSGLLSDWGKKGDIVKYQFSPSKKDTTWGKREWLNDYGKPIDEYMPSFKQ